MGLFFPQTDDLSQGQEASSIRLLEGCPHPYKRHPRLKAGKEGIT
jgi:hypothetical protein